MLLELPPTANLWRTDQLLASGLNSRAVARLVQMARPSSRPSVCAVAATPAAEWWRGS